MKRIEAWHTLHEMWNDATPEQKEALGIAMDDIEFVDLMRGHGVPLNNAQHIRSMTDEELVYCMNALNFCPPNIDEGKVCGDSANCYRCWLDWLKQPYEEGDNG